jgi:glycosyltransferase involved in cell wall biosynthesis
MMEAPMDQPRGAVPELCVVIPVLNERDNIAPMVSRLEEVLAGVDWEVIFVDDDSRDGTREAVRATAAMQPRVRLLHRIGRRGLASAFIEGAQASLATNIAAIDGDLQHDETLLPKMLASWIIGASISRQSRMPSMTMATAASGGWSSPISVERSVVAIADKDPDDRVGADGVVEGIPRLAHDRDVGGLGRDDGDDLLLPRKLRRHVGAARERIFELAAELGHLGLGVLDELFERRGGADVRSVSESQGTDGGGSEPRDAVPHE